MRNWVVDASPLILLAKVDQLQLLTQLPDALVIPVPVAEEIQTGPEDDQARQWLLQTEGDYVRPVTSVVPEVAAWDIGRGESAVLSCEVTPLWWTVIGLG